VTKQWQACTIADSTDPAANKLAVDASGHMQVDLAASSVSQAVTNAGTFATQVDGAALTALQLIDNPVAVDDTTTHSTGVTSVMGIGCVADPTDAAVTANDIGMPAMTTTRFVKVIAQSNSGVDIGDVDILSIAAGDNNIGNVDVLTIAAGDNNIGNVDVLSLIPGTGATNLGKAEDGPHTTGDVGVMALGIRDDTLSVFSGAENDYEPFHMTSTGRLYTSATVDAALPAGDNNVGNVDIVTVPAPLSTTGGGTEATALRVTIANDSTGLVTVDGITRTEYTVDAIAPAAPTGDAPLAERDDQLAALTEIEGDWTNLRASGKGALWVTIPDTNGDPITSFGGGTQYTEDDAAAANPIGTVQILVRDDAPNTQVTTDGDNVAQRGTNYGAAYVQVVSSGGAFIDSFGGSGGTAQADRSAFTDGTTTMTPIGGVFNDTPTDPTEDQAAAVRITDKRGLHVNLRNASGTAIGVAGAALVVDGSAVTQPVSNAGLTELAAAIDTEVQCDIVGALPTGTNTVGNVGLATRTAGGCAIFHLISAATTNATNIKAAAGQVYGWTIYNAATTQLFVKFHNTAGAPTAGVGVVRTVGIQAGTWASYSQPMGIAFATGIAITTVTGIADANASAVGASELSIDIEYA
jgi:hypothetical protein